MTLKLNLLILTSVVSFAAQAIGCNAESFLKSTIVSCMEGDYIDVNTTLILGIKTPKEVRDCIRCYCYRSQVECAPTSEKCRIHPPTIENLNLFDKVPRSTTTTTTTTTRQPTTTTTTPPPTRRTTATRTPKIITRFTANPTPSYTPSLTSEHYDYADMDDTSDTGEGSGDGAEETVGDADSPTEAPTMTETPTTQPPVETTTTHRRRSTRIISPSPPQTLQSTSTTAATRAPTTASTTQTPTTSTTTVSTTEKPSIVQKTVSKSINSEELEAAVKSVLKHAKPLTHFDQINNDLRSNQNFDGYANYGYQLAHPMVNKNRAFRPMEELRAEEILDPHAQVSDPYMYLMVVALVFAGLVALQLVIFMVYAFVQLKANRKQQTLRTPSAPKNSFKTSRNPINYDFDI